MTDPELTKLVDDAAAKLVEHADAVQIMITFNEGGCTRRLFRGAGNWYARQGMAHEFINADIAQEQAQQIAEKLAPPDEGESWRAEG